MCCCCLFGLAVCALLGRMVFWFVALRFGMVVVIVAGVYALVIRCCLGWLVCVCYGFLIGVWVACWVTCCVVYYLFLGFDLVVVMAVVVMLPDLAFCVFVFWLFGGFVYCDLRFWDFGGLVHGLDVISGFVWVYYLVIVVGWCYGLDGALAGVVILIADLVF